MNWSRITLVFLLLLGLTRVNGGIFKRFWAKKPKYINNSDKPISPVIFVPGDGGSQLEASLNKPAVVHYICQKHSDWFNIWLNLELLVPLVIDCWIDNVKLIYDNVTRTTRNNDGVEIRVPGWGNSDVVEWLDPSHISTGAYFKDIGNVLVQLGYERNVNIRGAPYDFRKAPNENQQWFVDFKTLIEDTYNANGDIPCTIIAHSMGGPMTLLFLHQQTPAWKDKYIAKIISLAGAWGGSVKAVKVFAMGDDLGAFALNAKVMKQEQITNPSLAWLMPSPFFWKPDEVIVETRNRKYTFNELREYFRDIDYMTGWEMRQDVLKYSVDFSPPGVEVHCLYGNGLDTVEKLEYSTNTPTGIPKLVSGDGDGTVNVRSLNACAHWNGLQKQKVTVQSFNGVDHMAILKDTNVVEYIMNALS